LNLQPSSILLLLLLLFLALLPSSPTLPLHPFVKCSDVHNLASNVSKCKFIRTVDSCQNSDGLVNYLEFVYCILPPNLIPLGMVILVSLSVVASGMWFDTIPQSICLATKIARYHQPSLVLMGVRIAW